MDGRTFAWGRVVAVGAVGDHAQLNYAYILDVLEADGEAIPEWSRDTIGITPEDGVNVARQLFVRDSRADHDSDAVSDIDPVESIDSTSTVQSVIRTLGLDDDDE